MKCPLERAGKAWGEIEEDGAACSSVRDVGRRGNQGLLVFTEGRPKN